MNPDNSRLLFVQFRSKRAGAQVSLSRIVSSQEIRAFNPYVLLGDAGWLGEYLTDNSIPHSVSPWPSPRSLASRLGGLRKFAERTLTHLHNEGITPSVIVANDHQETLLAHALAKAAGGVPVAVILRTPGMSWNDFKKYHCGRCDLIFARGEELSERVRLWSGKEVTCMLGSFADNDFYPTRFPAPSFPTKILVAGSEEPRKGFADVIEAIKHIEQTEPGFPAVEFVFTGDKTDELATHTGYPFRCRFSFVGRVEEFADFARQFDLAIHPSRSESFGMAPLELMLAGVPTMVSATGIINAMPLASPWSFPPANPPAIAAHLVQIWKQWAEGICDIPNLQRHIRTHYHISATTGILARKIQGFTDA